ncbi:MAG: CRISPR-associated helicase Cas3' [Deltaproteobacteria bacterium]|nr:CRISPR-associated helicase Cas3' [Deltaproteobacteria bacterium]
MTAIDDTAPTYLRYWGKADPAVAGGYHPAAYHSLDVACVAEGILQQSAVLRGKFARLLGLSEEATVATVAGLCAVHDLGKFDARFQAKVPEVVAMLNREAEWAGIVGKGFDHGSQGFVAFNDWATDDLVAYESLLGLWTAARPLLAAVCGHHGYVPTGGEKNTNTVPLKVRKADRAAQRAYVRDVIAMYQADGAVFPLQMTASLASQQLLAGLCSVADWVGSQVEFDEQPLFVYETTAMPLAQYRERARQIAQRVLRALPFGRSETRDVGFGELFRDSAGKPFAPRDVQVATELLTLGDEPALVIVEAAMGSGKTEAALSLASKWVRHGAASGWFVGLPTMATANGIMDRVEVTATRFFGGSEGGAQFRLSHGTARKNDAFDRIVKRSLRGRAALAASKDFDETEAEVQCARWFLPAKRALLAQVGVGTVDQAMMAALRTKHGFVRLFGLASSVVVIDEVHAYDAYMEVILERLVHWLGLLRTPVVLLSATLPAARRRAFVAGYRAGLAGAALDVHTDETPASQAYPLVTVARESGVEAHAATPTEQRTLAVEVVETALDRDAIDATHPEVIALVEAALAGEMVVWIRNTVDEARAAYKALRACAQERGLDPSRVWLFHSRFRQRDRAAIEKQVLAEFGREGRTCRCPTILVATQVVEQSLDLDFDRMVSDLAPIDLLLQRAGRLWRWARNADAPRRPAGAREVLRVLAPPSAARDGLRFGGGGYVYDKATLWLTHDSLKGVASVALPGSVRALIEATYDPTQRSKRLEAAPVREALLKAEAATADELAALRALAEKCTLPDPGAEARASADAVPDDEESVRAVTRVGSSVTLLPLWWDLETCEVRPLDAAFADDPMRYPAMGAFDAKSKTAWRDLDALQEQFVRMPEYDWDKVLRAATAKGEHEIWDAWAKGCSAFLEELRQRGVVILPMVLRGETFVGAIEFSKQIRTVKYAIREGLWVVREAKSG